MDLHGHCVGQTNPVTPEATTDRDQIHLCRNDTTSNGRGNLLGTLGTQANVAIRVTHKDIAHKAVGLTRRSHFLHGVDLQHLVLQRARGVEVVNDLGLLDGQRVQVDVLQLSDLAIIHQASQLCHGHPLLLFLLSLALALSLALFAFSLSFVSKTAFAKSTVSSHLAGLSERREVTIENQKKKRTNIYIYIYII